MITNDTIHENISEQNNNTHIWDVRVISEKRRLDSLG
jgi:hypothetical protein